MQIRKRDWSGNLKSADSVQYAGNHPVCTDAAHDKVRKSAKVEVSAVQGLSSLPKQRNVRENLAVH